MWCAVFEASRIVLSVCGVQFMKQAVYEASRIVLSVCGVQFLKQAG